MKTTKVKGLYRQLNALSWKEESWFVAKCLEVEIASQGRTEKEALYNLNEALELYFEDAPKGLTILPFESAKLDKLKVMYA